MQRHQRADQTVDLIQNDSSMQGSPLNGVDR
jgi:hypothetical protein